MVPVGDGLTPALFPTRNSCQPAYTHCTGTLHCHNNQKHRSRTQQESRLTDPAVGRLDLSLIVGHTMPIPATIYGRATVMVVDTAAQISTINQSLLDYLGQSITEPSAQIGIQMVNTVHICNATSFGSSHIPYNINNTDNLISYHDTIAL